MKKSSKDKFISAIAVAALISIDSAHAQGEGDSPIIEPKVQSNEAFDVPTYERNMYDLLDTFTGIWKGTLIISSETGQIIKLVSLNQSYWWDKHVLKGLATYGNEDRLEYAFSETSIENGTITAIIREGNQSRVMQATPTNTGLVWVPSDPTRIGREQSSEYVTQEEEKEVLVINGFELITNPPLEQKILIRAELVKQDANPSEPLP
ncbi:MAG: hypothetical protein AAGB06_06340 [Verrucomicrobiota bacterium]